MGSGPPGNRLAESIPWNRFLGGEEGFWSGSVNNALIIVIGPFSPMLSPHWMPETSQTFTCSRWLSEFFLGSQAASGIFFDF
jgi:hypothetical protein